MADESATGDRILPTATATLPLAAMMAEAAARPTLATTIRTRDTREASSRSKLATEPVAECLQRRRRPFDDEQ